MAQPLISIIIPTHNRPNFLAEAIGSVREQTYTNWEIIIIDDGSPLGCYTALQTANRSSKITWLRHEKPGGPGKARQTGISVASGEYIAFLDDDDFYLPSHFQRLIEVLPMTERKILRCGLIGQSADGRQTRFAGYSNQQATLEQYWATPSNLTALLFHRDVVAKVSIDLRRTTIEDFTWLTRVFYHFDLFQTNQYTAVYLLHDANRNNSPADPQHLTDRLSAMEAAYAYEGVAQRVSPTLKNRWVYHQYLHFTRNSLRIGRWSQAFEGLKGSLPHFTIHGTTELLYTFYFALTAALGWRK